MKQIFIPNMLLIAGTGRDSGKTTLACNIIGHLKNISGIIAVKISPHFHEPDSDMRVIVNTPDLFMAEEINSSKNKDSARMLKAGASQSFFIMSEDETLEKAWRYLSKEISNETAIICESGGLRQWIRPGLFFTMCRKHHAEKKEAHELRNLADRWITLDDDKIDFDYKKINFENNKWILNA